MTQRRPSHTSVPPGTREHGRVSQRWLRGSWVTLFATASSACATPLDPGVWRCTADARGRCFDEADIPPPDAQHAACRARVHPETDIPVHDDVVKTRFRVTSVVHGRASVDGLDVERVAQRAPAHRAAHGTAT